MHSMRPFAVALLVALPLTLARAQDDEKDEGDKFPPLDKITKGYEQVPGAPGETPLFTLWKREKDGQMLAKFPGGWNSRKFFIALTVSSGETFAGLQAGDQVVEFRQYGKQIAMIEPNIGVKSSGDKESQASVKRLFTDRVMLDFPILTMAGAPVVDLDALLLGNASTFFGYSARGINSRLASIKKAKAFPDNIEVAWEVPAAGGRLKIFHWSISVLPQKGGFKPRTSDSRVGYFTTTHQDLGKYKDDEVWVRYANRWRLEKADPKLKVSPPKEPIVFYVEHTTPIRYRRWVRQGILFWNQAFERIGIDGAMQVHFQDATTGAHMDKDPEDVRYNFVRWLNNDVGTAIGPSRVDPYTGEILDADIILTDGWIRHFEFEFNKIVPQFAMQGFAPETLAWLERHPRWDPRLRCMSEDEQQVELARRAARGVQAHGGHALAGHATDLLGDDPSDGLRNRVSQVNGYCLAADGRAFDLALLRAMLAVLPVDGGADKGDKKDEKSDEEKKKEEEEKKKKQEEMLDGVPERYIGPLLADLVAHEVGHTLGLRHNFKASSLYTLAEINAAEMRGKPFTGSVMDYNPTNFRVEKDAFQGDFGMAGIGPYDLWAIEYGYTFDEGSLEKILARCVEPQHAYATDEDTSGPDPLARRYDFSKDPRDYAIAQLTLAKFHRGQLLEKFVKKGEPWLKARQGYQLTLSLQTRALSMMGNWLGGAFISRHKKGDADRPPIEVVPATQQRAAMRFCIDNAFRDESFGLTPELLKYLSVEKWWDDGGMRFAFEDATYPVHDRVLAIQASVLTMLLNPTTLRRIHDNEAMVPAGEDRFTLAEVMRGVTDEIWSELAGGNGQPRVSSLRRNLQREHVDRLVDLALDDTGNTALRTISSLARLHLRSVATLIKNAPGGDDYTRAHLDDQLVKIEKTLDAAIVIDKGAGAGGGFFPFMFGKGTEQPADGDKR